MFFLVRFIIFLIVTCHSHVFYSILIDGNVDDYSTRIEELLPEEFQICALEYDVDGQYDLDELNYLVGISSPSIISRKDLQKSFFYLQACHKFASIQLNMVKDCDHAESYRCCFVLKKQKILSRLMISGMLRDKELLRHQYLMELGDHFDEKKHACGIEQMRTFLHDRGYFAADVQDRVIIDPQTFFVKLYLKIIKGSRFKIGSTELIFSDTGSVLQVDIVQLKKQLQTLFLSKLQGAFYSGLHINAVVEKMKKFLRQQGFINYDIVSRVNIDDAGMVSVTFDIVVQRKRKLMFIGNHFITTESILDHLMAYGKLTWNFPHALIVDEIEQLYKNKGFWNVSVRLQDHKDQVLCYITEGSCSIINNVVVRCLPKIISDSVVKKIAKKYLKRCHADKDNIKKMSDCILQHCKNHGYWKVSIVESRFLKKSCDNQYDLELVLAPGQQKIVGTCLLKGMDDFAHEFESFVACYQDKPFNVCFLQAQKQKINQWLLVHGYHRGMLDCAFFEHDNGVVDVTWTIELQEKRVEHGKTVILGNSTVPHKLLMNQVAHGVLSQTYKSGLEQTVNNFKTLPIYDQVQLYPGSTLDPDALKPIFVKLVEDDRYQIRTRFGMQQVGRNLQFLKGFTYKFGGSVSVNNLSNRADQTFIEVDITKFYRNFSFGYQFPWLFGKNIGSQWKLYDTSYDQPVFIGSQDSLYRATQQGFLLNTNYAASCKGAHCLINNSFGCEFLGLFQADQPDLNRIIDYDVCFLEKRVGYLFWQPTCLFEKVDSMISPHDGFITFASAKAMCDLNTKTSFFKILCEHTQYFSIHDQLTCAMRFRMGHVFNRSFEQINPIERFYLGGASSVRGYERDYCPPFGLLTKPIYDQHAGLPACSDDIWRYAAQGGRTMFNVNSDIRLNLYKNIGVVLFTDFGALFKHSLYQEFRSFKDSVCAGSGFGIRYDTPIGPLRFDVGWKWKVHDPHFEARYVWYLTLGQAF